MDNKRPFFHCSIADLEKIFCESRTNREELLKLSRELEHRTRPRARKLHEKVRTILEKGHEQCILELHMQSPDIKAGDDISQPESGGAGSLSRRGSTSSRIDLQKRLPDPVVQISESVQTTPRKGLLEIIRLFLKGI